MYSHPSHSSFPCIHQYCIPTFPSIIPELCCHFKNIINIHCLVAGSFWVPQLLWQECSSPQQAVPYLVSHHSSVDAVVKLWEGLSLCKGIMSVQWSFQVSYVCFSSRKTIAWVDTRIRNADSEQQDMTVQIPQPCIYCLVRWKTLWCGGSVFQSSMLSAWLQ